MHRGRKVLFVCKARNTSYGCSFGLHNSSRLVAAALNRLGVRADAVQVADNNGIDGEVSRRAPTDVVLEALWVVPPKLRLLVGRHPAVRWYVRMHSKTPFLASEGIAAGWLKEYSELPRNFSLAANSLCLVEDIEKAFLVPCAYQPNIYEEGEDPRRERRRERRADGLIHIGCFGAIRPLKNHLAQAFAAIEFAEGLGRKLRFHINGDRVEGRGEQALKNLRSLFPIRGHQLVEHPWLPHAEFLDLVATMDLGMQVSLTETFNIVAADFVVRGVPIVVSSDITWMPKMTQADPCNPASIRGAMKRVWRLRHLLDALGTWALRSHNEHARDAWVELLGRPAACGPQEAKEEEKKEKKEEEKKP